MGTNCLDSLLDIAIEKEEEAFHFYMNIYNQVDDESLKQTLIFLANEEKKHKEFLQKYREGDYAGSLDLSEVIDYRIAEHLSKPEPKYISDDADIYLIASHKELQSYEFYAALADLHPAGEAKDMLAAIANEEMKHKEKVEYFYSNSAFPQTHGG